MSAPLSVPVQVQNQEGRTGVCVYDNPAVTDSTHASAYVLWGDSTYSQVPRGTLTTFPGLPAFFTPIGPGN